MSYLEQRGSLQETVNSSSPTNHPHAVATTITSTSMISPKHPLYSCINQTNGITGVTPITQLVASNISSSIASFVQPQSHHTGGGNFGNSPRSMSPVVYRSPARQRPDITASIAVMHSPNKDQSRKKSKKVCVKLFRCCVFLMFCKARNFFFKCLIRNPVIL